MTHAAQLLTVTGEGGIGKTAYLDALRAHAEQHGFDVVVGQCHPDGVAPALWPWSEVVRPLQVLATPHTLDVLAPMLEGSEAQPASGTAVQTFDAVASLLRAAAERRPLLVVLEDIHWADTASLHLLQHVALARINAPILIVVTRRSTETATEPLLDCFAALARAGVTRVHLEGLAGPEVGALLETVVEGHDPEVDDFVAELTGGNPFFVLQYGEMSPGEQIPEGVTEVLLQRLRRLPEVVQSTLLAASVFGREFAAADLAQLVQHPLDQVLDSLDLAVAAGLVVCAGADHRFVHALAQDTAYGALSSGQRIRTHDRAAQILERRWGDRADTISAIDRHTWAAAHLSQQHHERAIRWRTKAAQLAQSRFAADEALQLWRDLQSTAPPGSAHLARAHGGAAVTLMQLSRIGEAAIEIETGVGLARSISEWDLLAELAATLAAAAPWAWPTHGRLRSGFVDNLKAALPHIRPESRAQMLAVLEVELFTLGRDEDRGHYATEALELSAGAEPLARQQVLLMISVGTTGIWSPSRRHDVVRELMSLEPTDGMLINALLSLAVIEWENRHPEAADRAMERCVVEARRLGTSSLDLPYAWWRATRARDRADVDADAFLTAALDLHRESGVGALSDASALVAIHRSQTRGNADLLLSCPTPASSTLQAMLAHALLEFGERESAVALMRLWSDGSPTIHHELVGICFRLLVTSQIGTPEEIRTALSPVEQRRGFAVELSAFADHCGVVDYFLAEGYAALNDERAVGVARDALRANQELGCVAWIERSASLLESLASRR